MPRRQQQSGAVAIPAARLVDREVIDEAILAAALADDEAVLGAEGDVGGRGDLAQQEALVQAGDALGRPPDNTGE